jgi:hypothetical protein
MLNFIKTDIYFKAAKLMFTCLFIESGFPSGVTYQQIVHNFGGSFHFPATAFE